jgi:hypothetical protein
MREEPLLGRVSRFLLGAGVGAIATLCFVRAGLVARDVSLLPLVSLLLLILTAALLGHAARAERERERGAGGRARARPLGRAEVGPAAPGGPPRRALPAGPRAVVSL